MRSRRRVVVGAGVAVVLIALIGCARLPTSGPVNAGNPAAQPDSIDFDLLAAGPQVGATQSEILQGFIDAATDARNGYQVARAFLTAAQADKWQPNAGATIDRLASRRYLAISTDAIQVTVEPVASLGPNGEYERDQSQSPIQFNYEFAKVNGEWRISAEPPGVLIDEQSFPRVFRSHSLYFFDPTFSYAVSDPRWFAGRDSLQTSIARALVAGPTRWLSSGVVSAIPQGSRLLADAVPLDGSAAVVSLSTPTIDATTVARMQFQFAQALASVPTVNSVRLVLDGVVQHPAVFSARVDVTRPRDDLVYTSSGFGRVGSDDAVAADSAMTARLGKRTPLAATVAGDSLAFTASDGLYRSQGSGEATRVDATADLLAPVVDGRGYVWTTARNAGNTIAVFARDGTRTELPSPWSAGSVRALAVSPDGTRAVALVDGSGTTQLVATAIVRNKDGAPTALGDRVIRIDSVVGDARDVTFLDNGTVLALFAVGSGSRMLTAVLGGIASSQDGPANAVQLSLSGSAGDLRVLSADGTLNVLSGAAWQVRVKGIQFVVRVSAF